MRLTLRQANGLLAALVLVAGAVLVWGTVQTYRHVPPIPEAVVSEEGASSSQPLTSKPGRPSSSAAT